MSIAPPRPKGPPLNSLRAFEAAARLGGFAAAANELSVTPGAIAQHIKALEAWAGVDLFERRSQGVELSPLGRNVIGRFSDAFDRLGDAVHALKSKAAIQSIRIAALPAIAQLWLAPRLPTVRQLVPEAVISVTALERPPNIRREPFDISIFYIDGPPPADAASIAADVIFPVCAPSLAAKIGQASDICKFPCLHDSSWSQDWPTWLDRALGGTKVQVSGPVYSLYALAIEDARQGAGIAIGHKSLITGDLSSGQLVAPLDVQVPTGKMLCMTTPERHLVSPILKAVIASLVRES